MVGSGHASFATEGLDGFRDTVIVGSHNDLVYALCQLGTFINPLDHRLSGQAYQWFARQSGRAVACWNHNDDLRRAHPLLFLHHSTRPLYSLTRM
jgi:hypothetical protein